MDNIVNPKKSMPQMVKIIKQYTQVLIPKFKC